jgi:hypothetical protein
MRTQSFLANPVEKYTMTKYRDSQLGISDVLQHYKHESASSVTPHAKGRRNAAHCVSSEDTRYRQVRL